MDAILDTLVNYLRLSGFGQLQFGNLVMIGIGLLFIFLAIRKGFEPLLLVPIGFGVLIGNIPYDSNQLSLGVYDGPVSEHEIAYYPVTYDADGQIVTISTLPESQRDHGPALVRAGQAIMVNNHATYAVPEAGKGLGSEAGGGGEADFGDASQVTSGIASGGSGGAGGAGGISGGGVVPAVVDLGQGRSVLVSDLTEHDGKYPQVWSAKKQDPTNASVFWYLYAGVGFGFFPPLIFLGVGALTDFGPMLANPKTLLLGAAAQFGIFGALLGAVLLGFNMNEAASIGIIGGADGPTAIFTCTTLAPHLLGAVALAAYSYMAMVPIIQPPIMKLLTTRSQRKIRMKQLKPVSRRVKIVFPIVAFLLTAFIAPGALPLLGMLFFGNLLRECMVTDRLAKTSQTVFIDIVTILLGVTVGAKTNAANFLTVQTIYIFALGVCAFAVATASGLLFAQLMNLLSKEKINPLIGAAGVSAVPMAARVVHTVGQKEDPHNFLLMHAMGPNVAGVIGSAVAAGVLLSRLAG